MGESDASSAFLLFSDVHLDPFADSSLVKALAVHIHNKNGGAPSQNSITAANAPFYQAAIGHATPATYNAAVAGLLSG
jgi:hypothetical protein